ncbi:MAG TPA: hypothetical protein VMR89_05600 [Actinomycetota bacterium]|nr:hypothetical protein [Actinomycetota bacterium]
MDASVWVSAREAISGIERLVAAAVGSEGGASLVRQLADISRSVEERRGWWWD